MSLRAPEPSSSFLSDLPAGRYGLSEHSSVAGTHERTDPIRLL